jgi:hypothetical protein
MMPAEHASTSSFFKCLAQPSAIWLRHELPVHKKRIFKICSLLVGFSRHHLASPWARVMKSCIASLSVSRIVAGLIRLLFVVFPASESYLKTALIAGKLCGQDARS